MDGIFDKRQLARLTRRRPKAVERWFRAYADTLYTFVYYRTGRDADLAADIVQETFAGAIGQIEKFDSKKGSMYAWLTYLSKNHIAKALRIKGRHVSYEQSRQSGDSGLRQCFELIATEPLPDEIIEQKETAELVQVTLANIPPNYREVLTEYYYEKKALKEIAGTENVSEGAVKALLYRARQAFREAFLRLGKTVNGAKLPGGGFDG